MPLGGMGNVFGRWGLRNGVILAPGAPELVTAPAVTPAGNSIVGTVLTCTTGTWTNTPSFTYQWLRAGVAIGGATAATYTSIAADGGRLLQCVVTATNGSGNASASSNQVGVGAIPAKTVDPVLSGTGAVGQTLNLTVGGWSGQPQTPHTYIWTRNGAEFKRTDTGNGVSDNYVLQAVDEGRLIGGLVQTHNQLGVSVAAPSVPANIAIGGAPATTGTPNTIAGQSHVAGIMSVIDPGSWSGNPSSWRYQWRRGGVDIAGATAINYTCVSADAGTILTCAIWGSNAIGESSSSYTSNSVPITA